MDIENIVKKIAEALGDKLGEEDLKVISGLLTPADPADGIDNGSTVDTAEEKTCFDSEEDAKEFGITDEEIAEYRDKYGDDWLAKLNEEIGACKPEAADITGDGDTNDSVNIEVKPVDVDGDKKADGMEISAEASEKKQFGGHQADDLKEAFGKKGEKSGDEKKDEKSDFGGHQADDLREAMERNKDKPKDEGVNIGKFAKSVLPHFR